MGFLRLLAIPLLFACVLMGSARAEPQDYRLGPQDQIQIKVYDLRTGTGEAYQWTAFTGEFTVAASGKVALPLVGELQASDRTTSDLAAAIADRLQKKVGLAAKPDASVQVTKYRPFYVMGSVEKPGEYDYRPDLTVLQSVSLAGGLSRVAGDSLLGFAREALTTRGDMRVLASDRLDLLARQARLDAEIKGADTIVFAGDLQSRQSDPVVARTLREEQLLFNAHRDALRSQTDALNQNKALLQREVVSLAAKDASLAQQLDINKKELDQVAGLVSRGLMVLPRQLELQRTTAQFESDRLDVQLATLRAHEDISKADQDILALKNKFRSDALQEAGEVRKQLAETNEKIATSQKLIFQSEVEAPATLSAETGALTVPDYFITRRVDGRSETQPANEGDPVEPGDVVRVEPKSRPSTADALPGGGPQGQGGASVVSN